MVSRLTTDLAIFLLFLGTLSSSRAFPTPNPLGPSAQGNNVPSVPQSRQRWGWVNPKVVELCAAGRLPTHPTPIPHLPTSTAPSS